LMVLSHLSLDSVEHQTNLIVVLVTSVLPHSHVPPTQVALELELEPIVKLVVLA